MTTLIKQTLESSTTASLSMGISAAASGDGALALSDGSTATGPATTAIGSAYVPFGAAGASATNDGAVAIGPGSSASGLFSVSLIGQATGNFSTSLGSEAAAFGEGSVCAGLGVVYADGGVSAGGWNNTLEVTGYSASAFGNGVKADGDYCIAIGATSYNGLAATVSGEGSFGIIMQDQHSRTFSAPNMLALLGGSFLVDPHTGSSPTSITAAKCGVDLSLVKDALLIPSGTDAEQPGQSGQPTPVNGMMRYNTTNNKFEGYINGAWETFTLT